MPRRVVLSSLDKEGLLALPENQDDLIRYYTFNESDLALIRQRRGDANRLGFAVQLCLLRFPGCATIAEIALDYFLAWPAEYAMDNILVLAALSLAKTTNSLNFPVIRRLNAAVIRHINKQVSRVLEPPMDWRRDSKISCPCEHCCEILLRVHRFLT
jgi:hypothetical protein